MAILTLTMVIHVRTLTLVLGNETLVMIYLPWLVVSGPGDGLARYNNPGDRFTDPSNTYTDPGYVYTDPGDGSWINVQKVSDFFTPNFCPQIASEEKKIKITFVTLSSS